jgi:hypothetical protein
MSSQKSFRVQVQRDYLNKLALGAPVQCLAELIWNALDAESSSVDVWFKSNELGVYEISVKDDGHGILFEDAEKLFSSLGGSWKANQMRTSNKNRFLHGQEGKGRFKAFALGRCVSWNIAYELNGEVYGFSIEGFEEEMDYFRITEPEPRSDLRPGVEVVISELHKNQKFFEVEEALKSFSPLFAQYLKSYPDVQVRFQGESISPTSSIHEDITLELGNFVVGGAEHSVQLEIVEWEVNVEKGIYFSNENGFPLDKYSKSIKVPGDYIYTAYLKSSAVTHLFNTGVLQLHNLEEGFNEVVEKAVSALQAHFGERHKQDSKALIKELKQSEVYPFVESPKNEKEKAVRKVFDAVVMEMGESIPEFKSAGKVAQVFQLELLKEAVENSPAQLQQKISQLLKLSPKSKSALEKLFQKII